MNFDHSTGNAVKAILNRLPREKIPSSEGLTAVSEAIASLVATPGTSDYHFIDWLVCEVYVASAKTSARVAAKQLSTQLGRKIEVVL